jgi:DNA-binding HxlR family transcriptional regulator
MSATRRYRLLCPIARALDRVGDRWTLLILRDLHAGPARFSDLQSLPGIASNLLTARLRQLEADGLIRRRDAEYGTTVYELTELGSETAPLLFELGKLGARFPPDEIVKRPGNLRTIAVTLKEACRRVVDSSLRLRAELIVDGEAFLLSVEDGSVDVTAGSVASPEASLETRYEPMVAVADGRMAFSEFAAKHVKLSAADPARGQALASLLADAILVMGQDFARDEVVR